MSDNQKMSKLVDGLTSDPQTWSNSSLVSVSQLTPSGLELLIKTAFDMRSLVRTKGGDDSLKHRVLASIFFEASTRTSCSFQTAMMRLGGTVIHVDAGTGGNSSSKKGETVSDTIKCLQCYTDVAVLRHPVTGTVTDSVLNGGLVKPLINAGDGTGEHPTQALLDLFTIVDELDLFGQPDASKNEPLTVVLLGDLRHGRTVHSLAKLLARSQQGFLKRRLVLRYCSPTTLRMPDYIKVYIDKIAKSAGCEITQEEYIGESEKVVKNAIENANVLYVTRVQKERFKSTKDYEVVKGAYVIDAKLMQQAPEKLIVMHPLPRVDEINTDFDPDPRAAYFRQMENGLFVRMAILSLVVAKGF
uniref:aspartate carbamoyltransferase n=1 Tax=Chaetoceros debilis TaxID=122233 RepID=A0A7S3QF13_9STRA|mmetsp:Transcript_29619/g.45253  ORF Transcript_29619/g.45253 Transcript_29619/m.45253 type:complete len:358 (+) Transcript_29619:193-1266(+)